jgi:hypothetical protein
MDPKILSGLALARLMRGKVPEWENDYIEKYIPQHLLDTLYSCAEWTDDEGYVWGFSRVWASKLYETKANVVVVASRPEGMGCHALKVVMPDMTIKNMYDHDLME